MEFLNPNFLYLLVVLVLLMLSKIVFFSKRNASLQVSNAETLKLFFNKGASLKIFSTVWLALDRRSSHGNDTLSIVATPRWLDEEV